MQPSQPAMPLLHRLLLVLLPLCSTQLVVASPSSDPASSRRDAEGPLSLTTTAASLISLPSSTVRVLVCGDSITQGQEGDFTWRYRLWEWFQSNSDALAELKTSQQRSTLNPESGADPALFSSSSSSSSSTTPPALLAPTLHYVGPYNGTLPAVVGPGGVDLQNPQTWGPYHPKVDPLFSPGGGSAHFAVYGRPAWLDTDKIEGVVAAHAPDVVALHLGFNDFGWWGRSPRELVGTMEELVVNARRARPDVRVLVADVSHRLKVLGREDIPGKTDEYNALLAEKVVEWSTVESPVVMVRVSEDYACHVDSCPAGIDGLHPNALGDFQIARAYTKVLHEQFGLGTEPLTVPPLKDIPGMKSIGRFRFNPMNVLMYPPVGIFMVVSFLSLVVVVVLRPRWMRIGRPAEKRYHLLPMSRDGMEGL